MSEAKYAKRLLTCSVGTRKYLNSKATARSHVRLENQLTKKDMNTSTDILSNDTLNTHKGMYMQTKNGNVAHVLADPNMSKETESAIAKMIDLAYQKLQNNEMQEM